MAPRISAAAAPAPAPAKRSGAAAAAAPVLDADTYLRELAGQTVLVWQLGDSSPQYLNVLAHNALGLLVQDDRSEYFLPWPSVRHLRLATGREHAELGSPAPRSPRKRNDPR